MAISLSGFRQSGAKQTIAKKLAKQYNEQQRKAQKRKGWSSLLGGVGGKLLGTALAGMTGGLAAPLLMAAGTFGGRKIAHELTRGMGADTGKISGGDIYGYGKEESKTLKGMLESQMAVDPTKERGGFGKDLLSSYVSAGMAGKLGGAKDFLKGGKGAPKFNEVLFGKEGWKGTAGAKEALFGKATEEVYSPYHDVTEGEDYQGLFFEQETESVLGPELGGAGTNILDILKGQNKAQGGLVQGGGTTPTISDYFATQGKTLGGSNKQSLAQTLGR